METTLVRYPAFFHLREDEGRRLHVGRPVLAPEFRAMKQGADAAVQALQRLVHASNATASEELLLKLSAIPDDAVDFSAQVTTRDGRRRVDIRTPALRFTLGAHPVVCLPRVHDAVLVLPANTPPESFPDALQEALDAWLRGHEPEEDEEEEQQPVAEQRGDRFVWLETRVRAPRPSFGPPSLASLLQSLGGQKPMSGREELAKVSASFADRFPDALRLDLVPDPRVGELQASLFHDANPAPIALIGPSGAGKTTLVEAATRRYLEARQERADRHNDVHLHHLDPNRVIAGMSVVGAWERRMTAILEHLTRRGSDGRGGLFVDNAVALSLVGRSAGSALNLCSLLRPWLAARRLPFVLEATPEEWNRLEEADRAFTELFSVIRVAAPPTSVALRMTLANLERIERAHSCAVPLSVVRRLIELDARYPGARVAPGSLVDRLEVLATRNGGLLEPDEVDALYSGTTGLDPELFDTTRPLPDAELRGRISARLVGQPEAVSVLTDVVHVLRAGLARPNRPLATWLLVGPTGVGKTEAAKVLADLLYPGRERLLRFDMNEMVDAGAVHRLLGDETQEGQLTGRVRQDPYSVVLLDEIEKAHPSVHDLLLQLLDEGRLTDARGRRADFGRAVVILTSNVGAGQRVAGPGFGGRGGSVTAAYRTAVERAFRPELVNRLDRIVVFQPLELPDIRRIARLQLQRMLLREGFLRRTVLMEVDDAALERLATAGFDPDLGARALKRTIERDVVGPMASLLASIPLEQPVLVHVRAQGDGVGAVATPLVHADRRDPRPEPPALTETRINTLLDELPSTTFRATASKDGVSVEGWEAHELRDALQEALRALTPDRPGVDLEDHALRRLHRAGARGWKVRSGRAWNGLSSYRSVREFLLDDQPGEPIFDDYPDELDPVRVAVLHRKLRSPPDAVRLRIRPVTRALPPEDEGILQWIATLEERVDALWPDRETWGRHPERGWERRSDDEQRLDGPRIWRIRGACAAELLAGEAGMHVWYPPDAPPFAVAVEVLPDGPAEDVPVTTDPPIVRLYLPHVPPQDTWRVEDLRVGEALEQPGYLPALPLMRWWWALMEGRDG